MRLIRVCAAVALGAMVASAVAQQGAGGFAGGGSLDAARGVERDDCISSEERAEVEADIEAFLQSPEGRALVARGIADQEAFRFYPQAGNLYRDLHHNNYVDLDPSAGVLDFACTDHTYDGHRGHDSGLRSFSEQEIGVPVFAVDDGVVVARRDGEPDRQTTLGNRPANSITIQHDSRVFTRYWHLKNGSVLPAIGQAVEAGEQIGLTASSGNSTGPHLHFEVRGPGGSVYEPMDGACNNDPSGWAEPWEIERAFRVRDFGFVRGRMIETYPGPPFEIPRSNHVDFSDTEVSYWMYGMNLPADATFRFQFFAPDGRADFDSGVRSFGFPAGEEFRRFWLIWDWNVPAMRAEAGEWTVRVDISGEEAVEFGVRVFETERPAASVNRPPVPVVAVIEPAAPAEDDVLWARVFPDLVHDDPDFDVVRYTYTWKVNGKTVRAITSAGHADALPASYRGPGDVVTCDVVASDGVCSGNLSGDDAVDSVDLAILLSAWGSATSDLNGDEIVDSGDLAVLLAGWGECP